MNCLFSGSGEARTKARYQARLVAFIRGCRVPVAWVALHSSAGYLLAVGGIPRRRFPPSFSNRRFFMRLGRRFLKFAAADSPLPPHGRRILRQRSEMGSRWIARREGSPLGRDLDAISWSVKFRLRWEGTTVRSSLSALRQEAKWNAMRCRVTATKTQCSHLALRPRLAGRRPEKTKLGKTRAIKLFLAGVRSCESDYKGDCTSQTRSRRRTSLHGSQGRYTSLRHRLFQA